MFRFVLSANLLFAVVLAQTAPTCKIQNGCTACEIGGVLTEVTEQRWYDRLRIEDLNLVSIKSGAFKNLAIKSLWLITDGRISTLESGSFTGLPRLITLLLDNNVVRLIPNLFQELPRLKVLGLANNQIDEIPDGTFNELSNLNNLDLHRNNISTISKGTFAGLSKLSSLWLDHNNIVSIESESFENLGELEDLHLDYNKISAIQPNTFKGLAKLKSLYLEDNSLTSVPPEAFRGLPKLKNLHLRHNKIARIQSNAFIGLSRLEQLSLNSNEISELQAGAFEGLSDVKDLYLNNNQIQTLPRGLFAGLDELESLYMTGNILTEVDRTYVQLRRTWYAGYMSYQQAESLLLQENKEGCFVIRNSPTREIYSLSLCIKVRGTQFATRWASPEVLNSHQFSSKSDVWAYGVLMWEVFTCGETPYGRLKEVEVADRVRREIVLENPKACCKEVYDVMRNCWSRRPRDRPSFQQLREKLKRFWSVQ